MTSRRARTVAATLAVALAVLLGGGCGRADPVPGGAASVPGPPPTPVALRPAPSAAPAAPPVRSTLVDGTPLDAARLWRDRAVVLVFFSSWCETCERRQERLSELARRYQGSVAFLGVDADDDPARLADYLRRHRTPYPVAVDADHTVWRAYAVDTAPGLVLIGRGGALLRGWPGGLDPADLDSRLRQLVLPG